MTNQMKKIDDLTPLQRAALALKEMRAKIDKMEQAAAEPMAIIGMGCRFPGSANSPERFWQLLEDGADTTTDIPENRWDVDRFYSTDRNKHWKMYTRRGSFLTEDVSLFDANFFGIAPREAISIDPQQRVLLEVAWEALENAGIAPDSLDGSATGVFIGLISIDYGRIPLETVSKEDLPYMGTGNAVSFPAGRLSYTLGLEGPSMVTATACSSTLVAMHQASLSLRARDCDLALVGGVNLMLSPEPPIVLSKLGALAPDGRCKSFDASANGYGRGEGAGILVLKRQSDALRDGDNILALLEGSAVNHDGATGGISVPNGPAQEKVLKRALNTAGLTPNDIDFIEAHGTGTPLGDPIELNALHQVFGPDREPDHPLVVGSVKSNIGHLEGAAGAAGLIKVIMSLAHNQIPANYGFENPSPHVDWAQMNLSVPRASQPWTARNGGRHAGISGFGLSGINAHVILGDAPLQQEPETTDEEAGPQLVTLTGKCDEALGELASRYLAALTDGDLSDVDLERLAHTTQSGRSHFNHRLAWVGESREELVAGLTAFCAGETNGTVTGTSHTAPQVAFLCSGQGSQYPDMGRDLYENEPVFRKHLDHVATLLRPHMDRDLLDVLYGDAKDKLSQTAYTQPALFALEVSLAELWRSWGVKPAFLSGHSVGEYAAAHLAGVFSLEDGARLIAARARLMQALPEGGVMVSFAADRATLTPLMEGLEDRLSLAASNGPRALVVSGEAAALEQLMARAGEAGLRHKRLDVSHAFHSHLMQPMLAEFASIAAEIIYHEPRIPLVSNLSGTWAGKEIAEARYWVDHVSAEVRFHEGMNTLAEQPGTVFLELGPKPVLLGMGRLCAADATGPWLPSLRPGRCDRRRMLQSLAELYVNGFLPEWDGLHQQDLRKVRLPNYPFQRQRFWVETSQTTTTGGIRPQPDANRHPLLGDRVPSPGKQIHFTARVNVNSPEFLDAHRVYGQAVLPGAAYVDMALAAGTRIFQDDRLRIQDLVFRTALSLEEQKTNELHLILEKLEKGSYHFDIYSLDPSGPEDEPRWITHASGTVTHQREERPVTGQNLQDLAGRVAHQVDPADYYEGFSKRGLDYGPEFQGITELGWWDDQVLARIQRHPDLHATSAPFLAHPALLDACFQAIGAGFEDDGENESESAFLPVGLDAFHFYRPLGEDFQVHTRIREDQEQKGREMAADLTLFAQDGTLLARVVGLRFKQVSRQLLMGTTGKKEPDWFYQVDWQEAAAQVGEEPFSADQYALILADETGIGESLARKLEAAGMSCTLAFQGSEFEEPGEGVVRLSSGSADDMKRLLEESCEKAPDHVFFLWGVSGDQETAVASNETALDACGSALNLIQTLCSGAAEAPALWMVTRSALASVGETPGGEPVLSPLWGLTKTLGFEHPELKPVYVDLDRTDPDSAADDLIRELRNNDGENQIAIRNGQRQVPRLMLSDFAPSRAGLERAGLKRDGSYLITGGLGDLGLETARRMGELGAGCLVLMSRRGREAAASEVLEKLEETGARIVIARGDVARARDVEAVIAEIQEGSFPLRGVIHAAGVLDDGIILQQNRDRFARVFASKLAGALNLHHATVDLELDHFVLFSSAAALMGKPGQANYVSANIFLDELAAWRRKKGLAGLSINWGAWGQVGLAAEHLSEEALSSQGVGLIEPQKGLDIFSQLLDFAGAQVGVMPVDWSQMQQLAAVPFFANFASEDDMAGGSSLLEEWAELPPATRLAKLETHVHATVADVLGFKPDRRISPVQGFFDLGMDSLMSVDLRNKLQASLGCTLPGSLAFDNPNIAQLTQFLAETLFDGADEVVDEEDAPAMDDELDALLMEVDGMSEKELVF